MCGIEIENPLNAVVENSKAYDNAGGILVFLLRDLSGYDNSWHQPGTSKLPVLLPDKTWLDFTRRVNWRLWKLLVKLPS